MCVWGGAVVRREWWWWWWCVCACCVQVLVVVVVVVRRRSHCAGGGVSVRGCTRGGRDHHQSSRSVMVSTGHCQSSREGQGLRVLSSKQHANQTQRPRTAP